MPYVLLGLVLAVTVDAFLTSMLPAAPLEKTSIPSPFVDLRLAPELSIVMLPRPVAWIASPLASTAPALVMPIVPVPADKALMPAPFELLTDQALLMVIAPLAALSVSCAKMPSFL